MTIAVGTWLRIVRLGLVQAALGGAVAFCIYPLTRIMIVEFKLAAIIPGVLVAWHHALQLLRPRLGHGSDVGGRRTPWIVGGMALLMVGTLGATAATCLLATSTLAGIVLAALSFTAVGVGVGAAGTSNLVLLAKQVDEKHRAAGATIVWIMMIVGIVVSAGVVGHMLEPFSLGRLMEVGAGVAAVTLLLALAAVWRLEATAPVGAPAAPAATERTRSRDFWPALRDVWSEPQARRFAIFVFLSMLAFNAQELVLEPFAGSVFRLSPGVSNKLLGVQQQGVLAGMLLFALVAGLARGSGFGSLRSWTVGGCFASAVLIGALAVSGFVGPAFPLWPCVFVLGIANGTFTAAAVGSMMQIVAARRGSEGVRMGLLGASQAIAAALGGLFGTGASDLAHIALGTQEAAYAATFALDALLFVVAALIAVGVSGAAEAHSRPIPFDRRVSIAGGSPEPRR